MTKIISISNQKGGVGKTTTAVNLSAALAQKGKRTLIVDCDPQANATTAIRINKSSLDYSLYHGLIGEAKMSDIIQTTAMENLMIAPSDVELIGFEVEMMATKGREEILKRLLSTVNDYVGESDSEDSVDTKISKTVSDNNTNSNFEYLIIDCPPSLSLLTLNALTAADSVIIPLQSEFLALEGVGQLIKTIKLIKQSFNPSLKIEGILMTMFDKRTNLSRQVAQDAEGYFKEMLFKTKIPRSIKLGEAPSYGMPVITYDPTSIASHSYLALADELISREEALMTKARETTTR
ncbi:MAG: ParA family protein [Desulfamplus sp.]|nr:ParA family protein [Desulfamplus sp.]